MLPLPKLLPDIVDGKPVYPEGIVLPINELGDECPYPFDPLLIAGLEHMGDPVPLGQYHCPYCGGMQIACVPHLDYRDEL